MATIITTTRRIYVKETVKEIFDKLGVQWTEFTEISYGEKMNGDRVPHERLIYVNKEFIIEIFDLNN